MAVDQQALPAPDERRLHCIVEASMMWPVPAFQQGLTLPPSDGPPQRTALRCFLVDRPHAAGCHGLITIFREALDIDHQPADGCPDDPFIPEVQTEQPTSEMVGHSPDLIGQFLIAQNELVPDLVWDDSGIVRQVPHDTVPGECRTMPPRGYSQRVQSLASG